MNGLVKMEYIGKAVQAPQINFNRLTRRRMAVAVQGGTHPSFKYANVSSSDVKFLESTKEWKVCEPETETEPKPETKKRTRKAKATSDS